MVDISLLNNSIVIAPRIFKNALLLYKFDNPFLNFKFFSKEDIQNELFGKNNDDVLAFSLKNSNLSLKTIKLYLECIFKGADTSSFKDLDDFKNLLKDNDYLKVDDSFKELFKNKRINIFIYTSEDLEMNNIINILNIKDNVNYYNCFDLPIKTKENNEYHEFKMIDDEVHYALLSILENINKYKKIKIVCQDNELFYLNVLANCYNLKLNNLNNKLIDRIETKFILKNIKNGNSISESINSALLEKPDNEYISKIKELDDLFSFDKLKDSLNVFKSILSSKRVNNKEFENEIDVGNNIDFDLNTTYYLLGCSELIIPNIKTNKSMFSELDKEKMGLTSLIVENKYNEDIAKLFLKFNNLKFISFHKIEGKDVLEKCSLFKELNILKAKNEIFNFDYSYKVSNAYYSKNKEIFNKYGEASEFYLNYKNFIENKGSIYSYKDFDNTFKGISRKNDGKNRYSYSSINSYFKCPFSYYLNRVLKIKDNETTFSLKYGNYAHKILEKVYDNDFDFFDEQLNAYFDENHMFIFTDKELCFANKKDKNLINAIDLIRKRKDETNITKTWSEKEISVDITDKINFNGKIDSIVEIDNKYLIVIDYKTGNTYDSFSRKTFKYGIGLQLPSYSFLIKNDNEFKRKNIVGLYIQPLKGASIIKPNDKEYLYKLRLQGISIDDLDIIDRFDPSLKTNLKSNYIDLSITTKGNFYKGEKTQSSEVLASFPKEVKNMIIKADKNIRKNEFDIAPVKIIDKSTGKIINDDVCTYCPYKNICFKNEKNYKEEIIEDEKESE